MELIIQALSFLGSYTQLISFLGGIFGGEETLIVFSILASSGFLDVWTLLVFFYLGTLVSDAIWYFLGKSRLFDWAINKKFISKAFFYWGRVLNIATRKSDFQALFFTKFFYGTRILTLMYLSKQRLGIKLFLIYNLVTNIIWVPIVLFIGWSAGKGISSFTKISDNLALYLFLIGITLLVFTILIRILSEVVIKWLKKKQKQ